MNVVHTSRRIALALVVGSAGMRNGNGRPTSG